MCIAKVRQVVWPPWAAKSKWWQHEHFKFKKSDFLLSTNFKLLRQIKGNSRNNCDSFFNFIISVWGGQCDCWSWVSTYLATPLPLHICISRCSLLNKIWILTFTSLYKLASKSQELLADISLSILLYLLFGLFFFVKQCRNRFNHLVSATHVCKQNRVTYFKTAPKAEQQFSIPYM